jgi:DNA (cytosine-5)-methyltransferase 1
MRYLTQALEDLGYRWAYRVVDARSFGVPQRRLRVLLVASTSENPCDVLFA